MPQKLRQFDLDLLAHNLGCLYYLDTHEFTVPVKIRMHTGRDRYCLICLSLDLRKIYIKQIPVRVMIAIFIFFFLLPSEDFRLVPYTCLFQN